MIHIAAGGIEHGKVMSLCTACAEQKLLIAAARSGILGSPNEQKNPDWLFTPFLRGASNGGSEGGFLECISIES